MGARNYFEWMDGSKMNDVKIIKGNFGECRIQDCIEGMKDIPDKSFDLCITDFPFNVDFESISNDNEWKQDKVLFNDKIQDYYKWASTIFNEIERICNRIFFFGGYKERKFWMNLRDFDLFYWVNDFRSGKTSIGFNKVELGYCLGDMDLGTNILKYNYGGAVLHNKNQIKYIHPTPKPSFVWEYIIKKINPNSVLDPFFGSGPTGEVCEILGIKWLGFEIEQRYIPDMEKRIKIGIRKYKQQNLDIYL